MTNQLEAIVQQQGVGRISDGNEVLVRATRDGSLITNDYIQQLAFEGRVFSATQGSVTTPVTFLVTAANRPDFWLRVPAGLIVIPLFLNVSIEGATGTLTEINHKFTSNDIGDGTSTAPTAGPRSLRTDQPVGPLGIPRQLATGDTTAETNPIELSRTVYIFTAADGATVGAGEAETSQPVQFTWSHKYGVAPVLVGPASWILYVSATTTQATGFAEMVWAESPAGAF